MPYLQLDFCFSPPPYKDIIKSYLQYFIVMHIVMHKLIPRKKQGTLQLNSK